MPRSKISRSAAFGIRKSYICERRITDISPVFFVLDTEGVFIVTFLRKIVSFGRVFWWNVFNKVQNNSERIHIFFEEKFY